MTDEPAQPRLASLRARGRFAGWRTQREAGEAARAAKQYHKGLTLFPSFSARCSEDSDPGMLFVVDGVVCWGMSAGK